MFSTQEVESEDTNTDFGMRIVESEEISETDVTGSNITLVDSRRDNTTLPECTEVVEESDLISLQPQPVCSPHSDL